MSIKLGLKVEYDDAAEEIGAGERTRFDPNEKAKQSKSSKATDSMLFGGGMNNRRKKDQSPNPKNLVPKIMEAIVLVSKVDDKAVIGQRPNQPEQHRNADVEVTQKVHFDSQGVFNRPGYIRKLKKVAEDFDFKNENSTRHFIQDVIRPIECERQMMGKSREPDFKDPEFPAHSSILTKNFKDAEVVWERHNGKNISFGKYIDPNDINPGQLSSPQFLSVLSSLAEREKNIKRLIQDQKASSDGFYMVRINVNSVWRYQVVDDKIPTLEGIPLCATSYPDSQVDAWPALIEKAYAKAFTSSYQVFNRNVPFQDYLRDLTGAPVQVFLPDDPAMSAAVKEALDLGQPVLAVPNESILKANLNPNYALSVISVNKGNIGLRNSFGTIDQKSSLNIGKEGSFELTTKQCNDYLNSVMISKVRGNYNTSTIQSKHRSGFFSTYSFIIENHIDGFLTISQIDEKMFPPTANYKYSPIRFILEKKSVEGGAVFINAAYRHQARNVDLEVSLSPGEYYIHVIGDWVKKEYDYFLTFYGSIPLNFKRLYSREFPSLLHQSLDKEAVEKGRLNSRGPINQHILYHEDSNLIIISVENTGDQLTDYTGDLSKANFEHLTLLNGKNPEQHFRGKTKEELHSLKADASRRWPIKLKPGAKHSWVLTTKENYHPDNLRKYKID